VESDLRHRLVAILAADGVGYSRMMARDDRATLAALEAARTVFARHVVEHEGRIVDTAGDSVLAIFSSVSSAVETALAVQRELTTAACDVPGHKVLRFRIGIHLGDVIEKPDGSVYGNGVNVAARVQALAGPGAVAVSSTIRGALGEAWPRLRFEDHGVHEVRNIAEPVHVLRVTQDDDPAREAVLGDRVLGREDSLVASSKQPPAAQSVLGRDHDISTLIDLLELARLNTVAGPGGVGKTTLVLVVARRVLDRFPHGAGWVDLAAISEPSFIVPAIAAACNVQSFNTFRGSPQQKSTLRSECRRVCNRGAKVRPCLTSWQTTWPMACCDR
jgi:class 3 adenylate cyclase